MTTISMESAEISIVLDSCYEMIQKLSARTPTMNFELRQLKQFVAKIRDNGEVSKDLREYANEMLN